MRDEHPGETKCVQETNLITPAMGQTSPAPSSPASSPPHLPPQQHTYISLSLLSSALHTPILQAYCVQVEHACAKRRGSLAPLSVTLTAVKYIRYAALRSLHSI